MVKEDSPENSGSENVPTQKRARTLALDSKTRKVFVVTAEFGPAPAATAGQSASPGLDSSGQLRPSRCWEVSLGNEGRKMKRRSHSARALLCLALLLVLAPGAGLTLS